MTSRNPIIVTVHGGVVQDVQFPAGCTVPVAVHDYDVDGVDDPGLDFDKEGDAYVEALWEPGDAVASANQAEDTPVADVEAQPNDPACIAFLDTITDAEAKSILAGVYRWLYWDFDLKCWSPDKDISGSDTVQFLCELLARPPEDLPEFLHAKPGGEP